MTNEQKYHVIRCFRKFDEFHKVCQQLNLPYFKKTHDGIGNTIHFGETWMTDQEFTLYSLAIEPKSHLIEFKVYINGPINTNGSLVYQAFEEHYGLLDYF